MAILLECHGNSFGGAVGMLWEHYGRKAWEYSGSARGCGNSMWEYARSIIRILWEWHGSTQGTAWEEHGKI